MVTVVTDQNFEAEVIKSNVPVLVDFWAPWCGPCLKQGPILEALADDVDAKKMKFCKMNVDENPVMAGSYNIMSLPTLFVFRKGTPIMQLVGLHAKADLMERLKEVIG